MIFLGTLYVVTIVLTLIAVIAWFYRQHILYPNLSTKDLLLYDGHILETIVMWFTILLIIATPVVNIMLAFGLLENLFKN